MKKKFFLVTFIAVQLFFIFFHIYKQSTVIRLSYDKQKYEKLASELLQQKQELQQSLHIAHARSTIKKYAQTKLAFKPIQLSQVKKHAL